MKTKKPIHLNNYFLIPIVIVICLSAVALSLILVTADNEIKSSVIQNAISLVSLIATSITIIFLYRTLTQQQEQIDTSKNDLEINRSLDLVYRQLELSLPAIKNKKFEELNNVFFFSDMEKNEIDDFIDFNYLELMDYIEMVHSHIDSLNHIITQSKIDNKEKDYLKRIVSNNLNSNFFYIFKELNKYNQFSPWLKNHITIILKLGEYRYKFLNENE